MKTLPCIRKRMKVHTSGMMAILFLAFMLVTACEKPNVKKYNPPADHTVREDGYMHKTGLAQPPCKLCYLSWL